MHKLVTQAGISLANNQGNIRKTLKDLGSKSSIRALVTAAGTAGLTYGLSEALGVSQAGTSFGDQLQRSAIQTGVSTGFNIITQDQSLGEALLQGAINIGTNTAGGLGAKYIGDIYDAGNIDALTHKALHALLGAGLGAAANRDDPGKGAAGGAIGAVTAEIVAGNLPDSMEARTRADAGRAVGTVAAVVVGQDGNAALLAATNTVENNLLHPAPTLEIEENRRVQSEALGEALATPISWLVEFQEGQVQRAVTEVHQLNEALRNPNLSFLEQQNLRTQLNNNLEYIGRMQVLFPTTVGDGLLLGGSILPAVGPGVKLAKDTVKASKMMAKGAFKLAPKRVLKATPPVAKAPAKTPPKKVTFKPSGEPAAKPTVKPAGKPTPAAEVTSTSIPKPTSSTTKASTSYERTSSYPASSSTSRSPQAPSTAPPASNSSTVQRLSAPRGEPNAGGRIRSFVTTKDEVYYRVYSDRPQGRFLTKTPPESRFRAKEGLALPPSNKATYIQEVHVPAGTRLQRSRALPAFGEKGGSEQFEILEKDMSKLIFTPGRTME